MVSLKELLVNTSPSALFFSSPQQRTTLARQRYFEEGEIPSGVINSEVLASWARCERMRLNPRDALAFNPVTASRAQLALQRNRQLIEAWNDELTEIERTLVGTSCSAILTDSSGVLVGATGPGRPDAKIVLSAHRVGINLSEESVGTTAPGLVLKTGKPAAVLGGEHFYEGVEPMYCAAAPIHNTLGQVVGVFDVSSEGKPFDFDATSVVSLYATSIENRLLQAQASEHLVLRLQVSPALLDTPMVGLVGVSGNGDVAWANGVALRLMGKLAQAAQPTVMSHVEEHFNATLAQLFDLTTDSAAPVRLANGLNVWVRATHPALDRRTPMRVSAQHAETSPTSQEPPTCISATPDEAEETAAKARVSDAPTLETPTLRDADADLVRRTVQALNGNISHAAKVLGVSRGLIYRRLKEPSAVPIGSKGSVAAG